MIFTNANEAFEVLYETILEYGDDINETKVLTNVGFKILNPLDNEITCEYRKWNKKYAEDEWQWYLSGNPNAIEISKKAKIWLNHMDENGNVNSNYGWQWLRNEQLNKIIDKLKKDKYTRQAVISIYDGKEIDKYNYDTPCTLAIHFQYFNNKLNMTVFMRSNDLVYGFCNDQYCFSNLLKLVSDALEMVPGEYYHFVSNLHIYKRHFNLLK
jgi:thymidylate synthase